MSETYVPVEHPRFKQVEKRIFTATIAPDCMSHSCKDRGAAKLDACCQYGCDVDLFERDKILARTHEIKALLRPEPREQPWFDDDETPDIDTPSGKLVRTTLFENRCVFLAHDARGCAIHRAALEGGWDMRGTKPHVCRLFPLSYTHDSIVVSEEYEDYSCAYEPSAPSLYRWGRDTLADVFGAELVSALDQVESLALPRHRLHLAPA